MKLPAGYRLRAPALGDLDAVAAVLIADELGEAGQIVLGMDFLRDEWSRAGLNLATDAWVVVGALIGHVGDDRGWVDDLGVLAPVPGPRGGGSPASPLVRHIRRSRGPARDLGRRR